MWQRLIQKLREPYAADFSPACYLKYALISGAFVFAFFFVNKPFGLGGVAAWISYLLYAGYGSITFLLVALNHLLLPRLLRKWFNEETWTIGKHIAFATWITLTIGIASFVFTRLVFQARRLPLSHLSLPFVLVGTFFIGAFLVTILTLFNQNLWLRRNAKTVSEANTQIGAHAGRKADLPAPDKPIEFVAENGKDIFTVLLSELLYIKSVENYVELHFKREGKVSHFLLRSSLTRVEERIQALQPQLFRCHRAYIVNFQKIFKVAGNAQGLRLTLRDVALTVPVARRYVGAFRTLVLPRL